MATATGIWFQADILAALHVVRFASDKYHPDFEVAIKMLEIALGIDSAVEYNLPREGWVWVRSE